MTTPQKMPEVQSPQSFEDSQSFVGHLDELRNRIFKCIIATFLASLAAYFYIDQILEFVLKPVGQLVFTSPQDAFVARIILALIVGVFIALPVNIYQIWKFVAAGLKQHESKIVLTYIPLSIGLFLLGAVFAYFVTIPIAIEFLLGFSTPNVVPMITIKNYITFVGTMLLAFGVVFELPLVLIFLTKIGIATPEFLIQKRRHAIVLLLILSALITPPDVITQLILAIPLVILYEIGIVATKITYRKKHDL